MNDVQNNVYSIASLVPICVIYQRRVLLQLAEFLRKTLQLKIFQQFIYIDNRAQRQWEFHMVLHQIKKFWLMSRSFAFPHVLEHKKQQ